MDVDLSPLDKAIRAVCPISGFSVKDGFVTDLLFRPEATDEQRLAANAVASGWDFSPTAEAARKQAADKVAAKTAVIALTPTERANRAAQRVVYQSVRSVIRQVNAMRAYILDPVNNPMPPVLPVRNWKQLLDAVRATIDTETDAEA